MARQLGEFGRKGDDDLFDDDAEPDVFTFHGEEFTLLTTIGALPLLRFARDARDLDSETKRLNRAKGRARSQKERDRNLEWEAELQMREQASLYEYLSAMLDEKDWSRFQDIAQSVGAGIVELMHVANQIIAAVTSRPTRLPGDSVAGQLTMTSGSPESLPSDGVQSQPDATPATFTAQPLTWGEPGATQTTPATAEGEPVSDAQVAAALGISERDAQMQRWRAEMVPVEEIDSVL